MNEKDSIIPPVTTSGIEKRFYITKTEITMFDNQSQQAATSEMYLYKDEFQAWVMELEKATYFKNYALAQGYMEAELPDGDYSIKLVFHKGAKKKK